MLTLRVRSFLPNDHHHNYDVDRQYDEVDDDDNDRDGDNFDHHNLPQGSPHLVLFCYVSLNIGKIISLMMMIVMMMFMIFVMIVMM